MKKHLMVTFLATTLALGACEGASGNRRDKTRDYGIDAKPLSELKAGIWVDPNGCHHWIIDDGIEGYLSPRLDREGRPVCSGPEMGNTALGEFKSGSNIQDPI